MNSDNSLLRGLLWTYAVVVFNVFMTGLIMNRTLGHFCAHTG